MKVEMVGIDNRNEKIPAVLQISGINSENPSPSDYVEQERIKYERDRQSRTNADGE